MEGGWRLRVSGSEAIRWDGGDTGHSPLPPTPPHLVLFLGPPPGRLKAGC